MPQGNDTVDRFERLRDRYAVARVELNRVRRLETPDFPETAAIEGLSAAELDRIEDYWLRLIGEIEWLAKHTHIAEADRPARRNIPNLIDEISVRARPRPRDLLGEF